MKSNKILGQHFLKSYFFAKKIVSCLSLTENDIVIEVGPGKGMLTNFLLNAKKLILIEKDKLLYQYLTKKYQNYKNVLILNNDILKIDLLNLIANNINNSNIKLISNLPYYLSKIFLEKMISWKFIDIFVLTIQKELGNRILAKNDSKENSYLTIKQNYYFKIQKIFDIQKEKFSPPPKVVSSTLVFKFKKTYLIKNSIDFFEFVLSIFYFKRKTLYNNLNLNFKKEKIYFAFNALNLKSSIRAENLDIWNIISLYFLLKLGFN